MYCSWYSFQTLHISVVCCFFVAESIPFYKCTSLFIHLLKDTCFPFCFSVAQSCPTLCNSMNYGMPGFPVFSIELVMPSNHVILCHPLLLLPSVFSRIFSSESALGIRWQNYWSFSFSISPSNEYSGLIFLRIDWFDLLAVQRILKNLHQHYSSKALLVLWHSAFFMVHLSHPYMTTGNTIALTVQTFPRCSLIWQASWWCLSVGDLSSSPL